VAALTPEDQQRLSTQPIDDGEPGTVVRACETLLAFIGDNTPTVSPKYHLLPMGSLIPLNAPMTRPMQLGLQASVTTGVCASPCPVPFGAHWPDCSGQAQGEDAGEPRKGARAVSRGR